MSNALELGKQTGSAKCKLENVELRIEKCEVAGGTRKESAKELTNQEH